MKHCHPSTGFMIRRINKEMKRERKLKIVISIVVIICSVLSLFIFLSY